MRALFLTSPGDGHVLPIVPLAWALRGTGHEVLVATSGSGVTAAAQAGLTCHDVAPEADLGAVRGRHLARMGELDQQQRFHAAMALFADISDHMIDGAVAVGRRWQPDLVVYTPLQAAGPVVAAVTGAELVEHGFQLTGVLRTIDLLLPHMGDALARHRLTPAELPAATGLDVCPPLLRSYSPAGQELGYRPYNGGAAVPAVLLARGSRPRICLTLGTSLPAELGGSMLDRMLAAATALDFEIVLAMGESARLADPPAGVIAQGWLPLSAVLPSCEVIVHHGGAGTTLAAAWTGTAQLVLPQLADQHFNAAQINRAGLGTSLPGEEFSVDSAVAAIERILGDGSAERALAAEQMRAMPDPATVVDQLTRFPAGVR